MRNKESGLMRFMSWVQKLLICMPSALFILNLRFEANYSFLQILLLIKY